MKRYLFFVASFVLIQACTSNTQKAELAISNVSIVDVLNGETIPGQSVFISGGQITHIVETEASGDEGARKVIDGSGKYLMPGLWDMHVHFRGGDSLISENKHLLNLFIANGVTTVRDAGGDITPAVLEWRKQIESGELTGPHIFTSGPKLDGLNPSWAGSIELSSVDEVSAAFDSLESLNVDYVKLYDSTIPRDVYLAAIEEAEKRGLPVTGHMPFTVRFDEAVTGGLDATEHMYYALKGTSSEEDPLTEEIIQRKDTHNPLGFWEALARIQETSSTETAQQTYALMKEHGTAVVPTLHIGEVLAYMVERDHSNDEYLSYIGPGIQKTYDRRLNAAKRRTDEATESIRRLEKRFTEMAGDMHRAGVTILAGSDSGPFNSFTYPGLSLHKELEAFVDAGLSAAEALKTSVINGPAFFGLEDTYGQVKEGFATDLLLLNSNPLDAIQNSKDIHAVILGGQTVLLKAQLDSLLKPD